MQVILKKDYGKMGAAMDVVDVKDGYARNYLIPMGIAVPATEGNRKMLAEMHKMSAKREGKKLTEAKALAARIEKIPCTIAVKVGEEDKIFGSVTNQEIAEFLKKEGFEVDRRNVKLEDPIKQLGVYNVPVELYKDIVATLKVWVVKEENA